MEKIAIVTDSNSGITQEKAKSLAFGCCRCPFYIDGELFYEDITLTQEEFYQRLAEDADISTSQPSPAEVTGLWDEVLQENDKIIYIPMSSGLSSSCETAMGLARDYEGKVYVVDNQRISITQQQSVWDAIEMRDKGMSAEEIVDVLMREKLEASIYITVDTLKYLKKGGRVTPAAAAIGTVLNLKPVLTIQGEKLDAFARCGVSKRPRRPCWTPWRKISRSGSPGRKSTWKAPTPALTKWPRVEAGDRGAAAGYDIVMDRLSLSVSCHIGRGPSPSPAARRLSCKI